jgi:excisionase family DNA binding protein
MNTYLTKNELASMLQISTRTLEHMMADGEITYLKIRRSIRFAPSVLDQLVVKGAQEAQQ